MRRTNTGSEEGILETHDIFDVDWAAGEERSGTGLRWGRRKSGEKVENDVRRGRTEKDLRVMKVKYE